MVWTAQYRDARRRVEPRTLRVVEAKLESTERAPGLAGLLAHTAERAQRARERGVELLVYSRDDEERGR
jgi:hypothetical protein